MRKLLFVAILMSVVFSATAQDNMMSKRGTPILPEAGDYSIGIDAVPFIDWVFDKSRIMSNTGVTSAGGAVRSQMPMTLVGKYMKDANTAYRAKLGINFNSHSTDYVIHVNDDSTDAGNHEVIDNVKVSQFGITLGAGIEKRRGKGRLHGIYGAEAMLMFQGGQKTTYDYGNAFILDDNASAQGDEYPTSPGFANIHFVDSMGNVSTITTDTRTTETKSGSGFGFGINAFVGVEYFVAPKMSVSAEYNWGIMLSSTGEGESTTETTVDPTGTSTTHTIRTTTSKTGKSSDFNVGVGDINTMSTGSVVFHFYF